MKNNGKILKTSVLNLIKDLRKWFIRNQKYIYTFLYMICCLVLNVSNLLKYQKAIIILLAGMILLLGLVVLDEYEKERFKIKHHIPINHRRFTKIENETVYIDKNELPEIVLYLNDIENYLEGLGYYN